MEVYPENLLSSTPSKARAYPCLTAGGWRGLLTGVGAARMLAGVNRRSKG
jgi:hypothetical protein